MYVFRADQLVLDDQVVSSYPRKTISHSRHYFLAYSSLSGVENSWFFSPVHFGMSIDLVLVQLMFRQSCLWGFMGVYSDIPRRHNITPNFLIFCLLDSFCPLYLTEPCAWCRCCFNGVTQTQKSRIACFFFFFFFGLRYLASNLLMWVHIPE